MKFPNEEAQLDTAIESLTAALREYFPVGTRVRVSCGRGYAYGHVCDVSDYMNGAILIQYENTKRYHLKHFHEVERV